MSRSILSANRSLPRASGDDRRARLDRIVAKRVTADAVRRERRSTGPPSTPGGVPIVVEDEGPDVVHGASVEELAAVANRLPAGALDGLRELELSLGLDAPGNRARPAFALLPGVWCGRTLGQYQRDPARIRVFGFVRGAASLEPWGVYLALHALTTFVHEVGHHEDFSRRMARGRWCADSRDRLELRAERREREWVREVVVPHLLETRRDEVEALLRWIEGAAGLPPGRRPPLRLADLTSDPRPAESAPPIDVAGAARRLALALPQGARAARRDFARELAMIGRRRLALRVIDALEDDRDDLQTTGFRALLLSAMGRLDEARALALLVVRAETAGLDATEAWLALTAVHERRGEWREALRVAEQAISAAAAAPTWALYRRGRARVRLGLRALAQDDVDALEALGALVLAAWLRLELTRSRGGAGLCPARGW